MKDCHIHHSDVPAPPHVMNFNLLHWKLGSKFDVNIEHKGEKNWKTVSVLTSAVSVELTLLFCLGGLVIFVVL